MFPQTHANSNSNNNEIKISSFELGGVEDEDCLLGEGGEYWPFIESATPSNNESVEVLVRSLTKGTATIPTNLFDFVGPSETHCAFNGLGVRISSSSFILIPNPRSSQLILFLLFLGWVWTLRFGWDGLLLFTVAFHHFSSCITFVNK